MKSYATKQDVIDLCRPLTAKEEERVEKLLPLISDALRYEATKVGKDLDKMIEEKESLISVAKMVTVDIAVRILRQEFTGEMMSQIAESANGYSWSGSYAIPGGGIAQAIMNNDLKRLGLKRQQLGVINLYGSED